MSVLLLDAAAVCTVLGLLSAAAVLTRARSVRLSVQVLIDFLVAAGLLRLSAEPGWRQVAAAAVLVAVRHLVAVALRTR